MRIVLEDIAFEDAETVILTEDMVRRLRQRVLIDQRESQERARRRRRVRRVIALAVLVGAAGVGLVL